MKQIFKTFLKVVYIIIAVVCMGLTAYYYVYLGHIRPQVEVKEKIVYRDVVKENIIKEETVDVIDDIIQTYIQEHPDKSEFSQYFLSFFNNTAGEKIYIKLQVHSPEGTQELLSHLIPQLKQTNGNNKKYLFHRDDIITINGIQKTDEFYVFTVEVTREEKTILEMQFEIQRATGDFYLTSVSNLEILFLYLNNHGFEKFQRNGFLIDYSSLKNTAVFDKEKKGWFYIDTKFGKRYHNNIVTILSSLEEFLASYKKGVSSLLHIEINKDMKPYILGKIFEDTSTTVGQKQNMNDKLIYLVDILEKTQIFMSEKLLSIENSSEEFIFALHFRIDKVVEKEKFVANNEYEAVMKEEYREKDIVELVNDFWRRNELLVTYLNNMTIPEIINYQ